jgi:hypothetical protein
MHTHRQIILSREAGNELILNEALPVMAAERGITGPSARRGFQREHPGVKLIAAMMNEAPCQNLTSTTASGTAPQLCTLAV